MGKLESPHVVSQPAWFFQVKELGSESSAVYGADQVVKYTLPSVGGSSILWAYEPDMQGIMNLPPINLMRLAGASGIDFLSRLSENRLSAHPMGDTAESNLPYFESWLRKKGKDDFGFLCPVTGSYRRHILGVRCLLAGSDGLLECKIPGNDFTHRELSDQDFRFAVRMMEKYGADAGVSEPVLMVDYPPGEVMLYGEPRLAEPRAIFFKYEDNQRLDDLNGGPVKRGYLEYVAGRNDMGVDELVNKVSSEVMGVLAKIHAAGIVLLGEAYLWNFALTVRARTKFVSDFGVSDTIETPHEYKTRAGEEFETVKLHLMNDILEPNLASDSMRKTVFDHAVRTYEETLRRNNPGMFKEYPPLY